MEKLNLSKQALFAWSAPSQSRNKVRLPDGTFFPFWDDRTVYRRTYHVAAQDANAADDNPGTREQPFQTIGRAAELLQPGEKVIVHAGLYRECVCPRRGGNGPDSMIAYQAADGEQVVVTGAVPWQPHCAPSSGYPRAAGAAPVWMADLPADFFIGYNPFLARNIYDAFSDYHRMPEVPRYLMRRGLVFVDGVKLTQVSRFTELAAQDGAFWVEDPGLRLHFRLPADADPARAKFEVSVKEQVFAPRERGLGYIRLTGFSFRCAADGVPVPQRAMVSTTCGHHWIIEKNQLSWANACGLDVGNQDWKAAPPAHEFGRHIIRANHVADCGVCGIAGCHNVDETLVEDNLVERIGWLGVKGTAEVAGLKFHVAKNVLIRRNVFRRLHHASGVFLDYLNQNCRITDNLFHHITASTGAAFLEVSHQPNLFDHNFFWEIEPSAADAGRASGAGVCTDSCDQTIIAYNFFGRISKFAVFVNNVQADRVVNGRKGECRENSVFNNVFFACPQRISLGRNDTNCCDGNLFDAADRDAVFDIENPKPEPPPGLALWQTAFGQDRRSIEARLKATFDPETNQFQFACAKIPEICVPVAQLGEETPAARPGPFTAEDWKPLK